MWTGHFISQKRIPFSLAVFGMSVRALFRFQRMHRARAGRFVEECRYVKFNTDETEVISLNGDEGSESGTEKDYIDLLKGKKLNGMEISNVEHM